MLETILDMIFPKRCVGCRKVGDFICSNCFASISFHVRTICPMCNAPSLTGRTHDKCKRNYGMDGLIPCVVYAGIIKKLAYQYKYKPYLSSLTKTIGELMVESLSENEIFFNVINKNTIITSVPLSSKRLKKRGYNHASLLGSHVAQYFTLKFDDSVLLRVRDTKPQFSLSRAERFSNVRDAFDISKKWKNNLKEKNIVLIDDIATSCSTLRECAKVLKKAGAQEVWGVVSARENKM